MKRTVLIIIVVLVMSLIGYLYFKQTPQEEMGRTLPEQEQEESTDVTDLHPMAIERLRERDYPASDIVVEETLPNGSNYKRYIASYQSDGLKIYGLLTIPNSPRPTNGYPTIVFLHGYIPPSQYTTTSGYTATQDGLARSGFITFKPDLRGHGRSEGDPEGAHFSEVYVVDTLNLILSLKEYDESDPDRIGVWGHSNGGEMMLRLMVISPDIKAGVSWAGVVGSFEDMLETYIDDIPFMRLNNPLVREHGLPSENPAFWQTIDPYFFLKDISGPAQLHHGTADYEVPIVLSQNLKNALEKVGKEVELYEYSGADHNFSGASFSLAMQRTIAFFNTHL